MICQNYEENLFAKDFYKKLRKCRHCQIKEFFKFLRILVPLLGVIIKIYWQPDLTLFLVFCWMFLSEVVVIIRRLPIIFRKKNKSEKKPIEEKTKENHKNTDFDILFETNGIATKILHYFDLSNPLNNGLPPTGQKLVTEVTLNPPRPNLLHIMNEMVNTYPKLTKINIIIDLDDPNPILDQFLNSFTWTSRPNYLGWKRLTETIRRKCLMDFKILHPNITIFLMIEDQNFHYSKTFKNQEFIPQPCLKCGKKQTHFTRTSDEKEYYICSSCHANFNRNWHPLEDTQEIVHN